MEPSNHGSWMILTVGAIARLAVSLSQTLSLFLSLQTPTRKSPNPAPPRPDMAGKIAGIFPIPIGPGSGKYSGFCPDPDSAGISGNRGIPIWPGSGK